MSLIAKGVRRVNYGDEWIEFKDAFSVTEMREIMEMQKKINGLDPMSDEVFEHSLALLDRTIVSWHVIGDDGNEVPYSKEAIYKLDMRVLQNLITEALSITKVAETKDEQKKELAA